MPRALPMRSLSALSVRHETDRELAEQTRALTPALREGLLELRRTTTDSEIDSMARVTKAGGVGEGGKGKPIQRIVKRSLVASLTAGRGLSARHAPSRLQGPAGGLASRRGVTERAAKWAETRSAKLVVQINEGTREAIRKVIAGSARVGLHVEATKKMLRDVIPLDARRAASVVNYRAALARSGVPEERAARLTSKLADRLVSQRAEVIARTEAFAAISEGRKDLWREMASEGLVAADKIQQQWVSSRDERLCEICEELDGQRSGLDGDFGGYSAPPDPHPSCRCVLTVQVEGY